MTVAVDIDDKERVAVLMFLSEGRRYCIELSKVREVVEVEGMERIDGASEDFIGAMVLREEPIPLVRVRNSETPSIDELPPICIILQQSHSVVGLVADTILNIRNLRPAREVRGLVAGDEPSRAYLDEDGKMVLAVDTDRWFSHRGGMPLLADQRALQEIVRKEDLIEAERDTYMIVAVGERLFAIDSTQVERAIDDAEEAELPQRPGVKIESVIEVSGHVLPVLRLTDAALSDQRIHIIVNCYAEKWAIATDRVLGIVPDESPAELLPEDGRARVVKSKGAFHEAIDLPALIASQVPDFTRGI